MPGYKEWSEIELQNLEFAASKFVTAKGISWRDVEKFVKTRSARQCQDRYKVLLTQLSSVKYNSWTAEEEELLRQLVSMHGHKWTMFVDYFPGREATKIKAKYYNGKGRPVPFSESTTDNTSQIEKFSFMQNTGQKQNVYGESQDTSAPRYDDQFSY